MTNTQTNRHADRQHTQPDTQAGQNGHAYISNMQTYRRTCGQRNRQDRQTNGHSKHAGDTYIQTQANTHANRQTNKQTHKHTYTHTSNHACTQANIHTEEHARRDVNTQRDTDMQTNKHAHIRTGQ